MALTAHTLFKVPMRYLEPSFSVPPAQLKADKNRHGQTWEDIWNTPPCRCIENGEDGTNQHSGPSGRVFKIPSSKRTASHPCTNHVHNYATSPAFQEIVDTPCDYGKVSICTHGSVPDATGDSLQHADTGHTCNGTYKTFSAAHCPYCWAEHAR